MSKNRLSVSYAVMLFSALVMGLVSGCASGGFKLTRQYAGFVNKQNIIIRIVLYILTAVVFAVTMLVDMVIFNTMDFWDGRVSQGTYNFEQDGMKYAVHHSYAEGRRKSHIEIFNAEDKKVQDVVLTEIQNGDIELFVDGKLKNRVSDVSTLPLLTHFESGKVKSQENLWSNPGFLALKK